MGGAFTHSFGAQGATGGGGPPPVPGAFTALRLRSQRNGIVYGLTSRVTVMEIDFKSGGGEISKTGTTAFEGGTGIVSGPAANAFDDAAGSGWSRQNTDGTAYCGLYGYSPGVTPDALSLVSNSSGASIEAPVRFTVEGSDDTTDGTDGTWHILYTTSSDQAWSDSETKNFSIVAAAPVIVYNEYPAITGSDHSVGQTVTCSTGSWASLSTLSYAYQWKNNGVNIGGATSSSYTIQAGDSGDVLTCEVTATNATGSTTAVGGPIIGGETAHRYWRMKVTAAPGAFVAAAEQEWKETPNSGPDLATGGTALQDSNFGGLPASSAFDNDLSSLWACNGTGTNAYLGYDFGSGNAKNINWMSYTVRNDGSYTQNWTAATIDYSDDGSAWTVKWSESGVSWSGAGQRQTFTP